MVSKGELTNNGVEKLRKKQEVVVEMAAVFCRAEAEENMAYDEANSSL